MFCVWLLFARMDKKILFFVKKQAETPKEEIYKELKEPKETDNELKHEELQEEIYKELKDPKETNNEIRCEECQAVFVNKSNLGKHLRKIHGKAGFKAMNTMLKGLKELKSEDKIQRINMLGNEIKRIKSDDEIEEEIATIKAKIDRVNKANSVTELSIVESTNEIRADLKEQLKSRVKLCKTCGTRKDILHRHPKERPVELFRKVGLSFEIYLLGVVLKVSDIAEENNIFSIFIKVHTANSTNCIARITSNIKENLPIISFSHDKILEIKKGVKMGEVVTAMLPFSNVNIFSNKIYKPGNPSGCFLLSQMKIPEEDLESDNQYGLNGLAQLNYYVKPNLLPNFQGTLVGFFDHPCFKCDCDRNCVDCKCEPIVTLCKCFETKPVLKLKCKDFRVFKLEASKWGDFFGGRKVSCKLGLEIRGKHVLLCVHDEIILGDYKNISKD